MKLLREFDETKPVRIYRNLHKACYSVQQGGVVVAHTNYLLLKDATFIVQPAGRERVRKEGKKNVHAFVKGTIVPEIRWIKQPKRAMYNPYRFDTFVDGMTWKPIHSAAFVLVSEVGLLYAQEGASNEH